MASLRQIPISNSTVLIRSRHSSTAQRLAIHHVRLLSTTPKKKAVVIDSSDRLVHEAPQAPEDIQQSTVSPLSMLPTSLLIRSLAINQFLSSPFLVKPGLKIAGLMAHSKSWLLSPDRNPIIHAVLRPTFYAQFAAGKNATEVGRTISELKNIGFSGVIVGYAKECVVDHAKGKEGVAECEKKSAMASLSLDEEILKSWIDGNLESVKMVGKGDFVALKFTGAGPLVTTAMANNGSPPPAFWSALNEMASLAISRGVRIWIDAEQQVFQDCIDAWTIDLMRKHNRNGKIVVYTTMQAYLKRTPENILQHLKLAKAEGWGLGIKLVRGAYIAAEKRSCIHDTKEQTDQCYDTIVSNLLHRYYPGLDAKGESFPGLALFLASHNAASVKKAYELQRSLIISKTPTIRLEYGQLQGMADDVSCGILQLREKAEKAGERFGGERAELEKQAAPRGFKCMAWGTAGECMGYLVRRGVENAGALDRTKELAGMMRREVWRRMTSVFSAKV